MHSFAQYTAKNTDAEEQRFGTLRLDLVAQDILRKTGESLLIHLYIYNRFTVLHVLESQLSKFQSFPTIFLPEYAEILSIRPTWDVAYLHFSIL